MIYVYAKYQKPTPYIKRDIANVKVFTTPAGRPAGRNRHYIDSHCIACESKIPPKKPGVAISYLSLSLGCNIFKNLNNILPVKTLYFYAAL